MSYLLHNFHPLVKQWADLSKKGQNPGDDLCLQTKEAIACTKHFQELILQACLNSGNESSCRLGIITTARSIISLLDELNELIKLNQESGELLTEWETGLIQNLNWLNHYFGDESWLTLPVPHKIAAREKEFLVSSLTLYRNDENAEQRYLASLLEKGFEKAWHENQRLNYRLLWYTRSWLKAITEKENALVIAGLTSLIALSIEYNFNDPSLLSYLLTEIPKQCIISAEGNINHGWLRLQEAMLAVPAKEGLYPGQVSVKNSILSLINSRLLQLKEKEQYLTDVYGKNTCLNNQQSKSDTTTTTLSVSQLAVWCRLIIDCNIIRSSSQADLLRKVAGSLQTTRTTTISSESLRVKYYTPEPAAINIVKEHLRLMINQLARY